MAVLDASTHARLLKQAELQFRLMVAVRTACTLQIQPLKVPVAFTFGRQTVRGDELALSVDEADEAAAIIEHTVTYTLALQIVQAMKDVLGDPRKHPDATIRAAFEIARSVRNAFAHQPFAPHWSIDAHCRRQVFEVPGVARLDTSTIDQQPVHWQDYGGMLAMYRLSKFVRSVISPAEPVTLTAEVESDSPEANPGDIIQIGRLLLTCLDKLPEGAVPIPTNGPIEIEGPDGTYTIGRRSGDESQP